MSCRRCGEEETFIDGNEGEELCKHCLDHCCERCFGELHSEEEYEHYVCDDCYESDNVMEEKIKDFEKDFQKSYCNYCSRICEGKHTCGKEMLEDTLLNIVGGEKGLVKQILGYKRDLEQEEKIVNIHRFVFLEIYDKIKTIKVKNKFEKKLEISFKPEGKYSKTYTCNLELNEPITFEDRPDLFEIFFRTFDIPLASFMRKMKTNDKLEECLKQHIKKLNEIHYDFKEDDKLH